MAIPFLHNINLDNNQLLNAKLHITSSAPAAAKGQIYLDSSSGVNKLKYHNGSGFVIANATISAAFNTSNGIITFTTSAADTYTVDIDGRFIKDFTLTGDSGTDQTISNGDTLDIAGGTYISTVVGNTDTVTINHDNTTRSDTVTSASPGYGGTFDIIDSVTTNATGHVTGVNVETITIPPKTTWTLTANSGTDQTIEDGDTVDIEGGTVISTVVGATDKVTVNHSNVERVDTTSTDAPAFNGTFEAVTSVTTTDQGHVTAIDVSTVTIPQNDSIDVSAITTDASYYPLFVTDSGADKAVNIDGSTSDKLSYNPSTQTLTVKNLVVDGTQTISNETVQVVENNTILFEGSTADDHETKLTVIDPTADRTLSLPNKSGTLATTDDVAEKGFAVDLDATESAVTKSSNTYTVTHTFDSKDLVIQVYHKTNYDTVFVDTTRDSDTTITVAFANTVTDGDYRVLIQKIG